MAPGLFRESMHGLPQGALHRVRRSDRIAPDPQPGPIVLPPEPPPRNRAPNTPRNGGADPRRSARKPSQEACPLLGAGHRQPALGSKTGTIAVPPKNTQKTPAHLSDPDIFKGCWIQNNPVN